jgi:hypothetical protein
VCAYLYRVGKAQVGERADDSSDGPGLGRPLSFVPLDLNLLEAGASRGRGAPSLRSERSANSIATLSAAVLAGQSGVILTPRPPPTSPAKDPAVASKLPMRKVMFASFFIVAAWSIGLDGQTRADFSGSWVLDDRCCNPGTGWKPSETIPGRLTVRQPMTTTDATGAAMPPEYIALIVKRDFADRTQEETYPIELVGEAGSRPPVQSRQTRVAAQWRGTFFLQIELKVFTAAGDAERSPWTEFWRIDDLGRLVITVATKGPGTVDSYVLAYRREGEA